MKVRHGFVSNSSSSSFCCFTTQEISDKAEATLTEEERKEIKRVLCSYELGDVILIGYESSSNGDGSYLGGLPSDEYDYEEWERMDEAVDAWRHAVEKVGGENPIVKIDIDI